MHTINLFTQRPKLMEACDVNLMNCDAFWEECLCSTFPQLMSIGKYTVKETMVHDWNLE
jgi:hypothetical protein